MKKLLFIAFTVVVFSSCKSKEEKIKDAVKIYIQHHIIYPETYRAIRWGKTDSIKEYWTYGDGWDICKNLIDSSFYYARLIDSTNINTEKIFYRNRYKYFQNTLDSFDLIHAPKFKGYKIFHEYTSKIMNGTNATHINIFDIDKDSLKVYWQEIPL